MKFGIYVSTIKLARINQLMDEAIQIAAIMNSINEQAFGGVSPIISSCFQTGRNSLLGIGSAFISIFSIYYHVRNVFSKFQVDKKISTEFLKLASPLLLLNPAGYNQWETMNELVEALTGGYLTLFIGAGIPRSLICSGPLKSPV